MPLQVKDARTVDKTTYSYIVEHNVSVPLQIGGLIRCNVYRPKSTDEGEKFPVLATYGPYGKDIPYSEFHPGSFKSVPSEHQTGQSAWETPTPSYWTKHGYVVVRADEVGTGQSPGKLDILSRGNTVEAFYDLIEWAAEQEWSSGKVGLLGISYFATTQWWVASMNPKGLAAIVPWEGFADIYADAIRHGGILSTTFFGNLRDRRLAAKLAQSPGFTGNWFDRQVSSNQYGLPGRAARHYGPDTVDGDLSPEELYENRVDFVHDTHKYRYRDDKRWTQVNFNPEDIRVPILSGANWGGVGLHLRGNVCAYMQAASEFKYIRFFVGRHDLPFYYPEEVEVQRSFLDAFLKGEDRVGWSVKGAVPSVDLMLRKGYDVKASDPEGEKRFSRRTETEWPIARTQYTKFYLSYDMGLRRGIPAEPFPRKLSYEALGTQQSPQSIVFTTSAFESETEVTGHITAHLNVSVTANLRSNITPSDIDLFLTLRHISAAGKEIFYTGSFGDPIPVTRGWLRVSLRKVNESHPKHREWLPHRDYCLTNVQPVIPGEVYAVDIELWPTNVVVQPGGKLVLEVSSGDTAQSGVWEHNDPIDRSKATFEGINSIHFGPSYTSYMTLPIIPPI
ncbi:CocE/NonD family hydrolase [Aspergillus ibericus CBS 121593]|uniref:Xaa-Pro dipeptidyl-peptidase C-terminal domain-containing protein n=1 Tax=Aspergillus ibericus CBS 121593 TaxID=1448316 RepID=A0A395GTU7_9EURO|nr:hypothetical protein BO80DRAFT_152597 [Aspergillus ibericus CBS 121593]RAK98832.1 hypothetical protein BO80DRAFT_152597 [Aspergillus ibericus CBS 121593]